MSWHGKCVAEEDACLVVPREQKQSGGGVRINQLIRQMCTVISLITVFMDDTWSQGTHPRTYFLFPSPFSSPSSYKPVRQCSRGPITSQRHHLWTYVRQRSSLQHMKYYGAFQVQIRTHPQPLVSLGTFNICASFHSITRWRAGPEGNGTCCQACGLDWDSPKSSWWEEKADSL